MKIKSKILIALIAISILISCKDHEKEIFQSSSENETSIAKANWPGYEPISSEFDYPANTKTLTAALDSGNTALLREHAWSLFAGMMQPAKNNTDWPIWYTWPNSVDAMRIKEIYCQGDTGLQSELKVFKTLSLIQRNKLHVTQQAILDTLKTPYYRMPKPVIDQFKKLNIFTNSSCSAIIPGKHFLFNGDIMIPTESLSEGAFNWINKNTFYNKAVLDSLYKINKGSSISAPKDYIVTKHMYWPVLQNQLNLIPVWHPNDYNPNFSGYVGYELWKHFVAVDTRSLSSELALPLRYLYNVYNWENEQAIGPVNAPYRSVKKVGIDNFYYHKITQADWDSFDNSDKAILLASSYWAYNKPIGVGDYLITIASHINTKELYSWTMQSAWWTDQPEIGPYSLNKPKLPNAKGPWKNYHLVEAYGLPRVTGGNELPMASNPYIELVIHPMQTNCNNCHIRAGYPEIAVTNDSTQAGYQNKLCYNMLRKLYDTSACFKNYLRTDFQWIIPDYSHSLLLCKDKK